MLNKIIEMKVLVILCSDEFNIRDSENIKILKKCMDDLSDVNVHYCGISSNDDFSNYENIISFKYKIINNKRQLNKMCDFITEYKERFQYDWFIKIRPDIKIIEMFDFSILSDKAINARARVYNGPKSIKYGMSVNGKGIWKNIGDCNYCEYEKDIILDDMIYIFHNNVVKMDIFDKIHTNKRENEWLHTEIWKQRQICFNIIGINLVFTKNDTFSGDINI